MYVGWVAIWYAVFGTLISNATWNQPKLYKMPKSFLDVWIDSSKLVLLQIIYVGAVANHVLVVCLLLGDTS